MKPKASHPPLPLFETLQLSGPQSATAALARLLTDEILDRDFNWASNTPRLARLLKQSLENWDPARVEATLQAAFDSTLESSLKSDLETQEPKKATARTGTQENPLVPLGWVTILSEGLTPLPRFKPEILTALLDQPEIREFLREMMQETLTHFVKRASSPLTKSRLGSGMLARAKDLAEKAGTGGILGAVTESLNQEAERRITEFVDDAVSGTLKRLASRLCEEDAEEKTSLLLKHMAKSAHQIDSTLWIDQLREFKPAVRLTKLLTALFEITQSPEFEPWIQKQALLLKPLPHQTPRSLLQALSLEQPCVSLMTDLIEEELRHFFSGSGFKAWSEDYT